MRVLILTSSTGGGHNTRARAFANWAAREQDLGIEVSIHQTLEGTHGLYHFGVELYNWIQRTAPVLHHIYFNFLEYAAMFGPKKKILGATRFEQVLMEQKPDVILSVHGSLNHAFFETARRTLANPKLRCVTYCGELSGGYGFSQHWVNPEADLFIGAVPETCEAARKFGMPPEREMVGGFLLDPRFYEPRLSLEGKRRCIIEELQLDPDRFILLLATGAVGANNHVSLLEALRRAGVQPQVVVMCGKSTATWQSVSEWSVENPSIPVKALMYTDKMPILLQCASAVVARPGTGTTSESILSECPVIANGIGGIMPQELITIQYCRAHQFDNVVRRPSDLPPIIGRWLREPGELERIKKQMRGAQPAGSPRNILQAVTGMTGVEK